MRRERRRPTYDLNEAKELARAGRVLMSRRARRFIANRYETADELGFASQLIQSIAPCHFVKSVELDVSPGTWADVYRGTPYAGETWYVKFYVGNQGRVSINILSANWDGYIH